MLISNYSDARRAFDRSGKARKIKGARCLTSRIYMMELPDRTIAFGYLHGTGSNEHPWRFEADISITPDNLLRAAKQRPDPTVLHYFGLWAQKSQTVKKRGTQFTDAITKNAQPFWQTAPLEFDLATRTSLNPDESTLEWNRPKRNQFNKWMRELKQQFYMRAKLGVLLNEETAPHFFNDRHPYYRYVYWGSKKLADPMKVFEAIRFEKPEELRPFTAVMSGHNLGTKGGFADAFPYERQTQEIDRIFASNRVRLQEQYGARQYR